MSIQDKIKELESKITKPTESELNEIEMMSRQIKKAEQYESFLNHPVTKEVVERIMDWIRDTNLLLLDRSSIINSEREKAITERDILVNILNIFSPKKANILELEKHIDNKIKEVSDFFQSRK
jgi:hypothetical protein